MDKPLHHQVIIVKINDIEKHPNADTLNIIRINGYQVITKIGNFNVEDLGVYIFPDSVVPKTEPFRFIWENYQTEPNGEVPEKRRRITVRKFRGEWSEGLLLPMSDFPQLYQKYYDEDNKLITIPVFREGDDVSETLGITHYDSDKGVEGTKGANMNGPRRRYPRSLRGWFFWVLRWFGFGKQYVEEINFKLPTYDVEPLKNHKNGFKEGEDVIYTEKIHGSNARFVFIDGHMYAGSHYRWKAPNSNCVWRKCLEQNHWIEEWCRAHEGYALYGEVTPTKKGFDYGCKDGQTRLFVFDIRVPEGKWPGTSKWASVTEGRDLLPDADKWVPIIAAGVFSMDTAKAFADGPSLVNGVKHIREGVVVRPLTERHILGLGRLILKVVSNTFLEKDNK